MAALPGRLLTAILAVGLLGAGVVAVLRAPVVSAPLRVPLFPRGLGQARTVSLSSLAGGEPEDGPSPARRATIFTGAVEEIRRAPRLVVVLAPATGQARVLGAQLQLAGSACAWELREPSSLDAEAIVALDRTSDCAGEERSGPAEATLVVRRPPAEGVPRTAAAILGVGQDTKGPPVPRGTGGPRFRIRNDRGLDQTSSPSLMCSGSTRYSAS